MANSFSSLKIKFSFLTIIRYTKITVIILMTGGFIWICWFLYNNLYKPLTQAMVLAELKAKVALITVNRTELEEIIRFIDARKQPPAIDWATIPDPTANIHVPPPPSTNIPPPT